jgi:transcriptional regulator with XRE-family HTH domain
MSEKFGAKVKMFRKARGMTLDDLAQVIMSSKAYVWQIENRTNVRPSAELVIRIANHFGESPEFFLDDTQETPTEGQIEISVMEKFRTLSYKDKCAVEKVVSGLAIHGVINNSDFLINMSEVHADCA